MDSVLTVEPLMVVVIEMLGVPSAAKDADAKLNTRHAATIIDKIFFIVNQYSFQLGLPAKTTKREDRRSLPSMDLLCSIEYVQVAAGYEVIKGLLYRYVELVVASISLDNVPYINIAAPYKGLHAVHIGNSDIISKDMVNIVDLCIASDDSVCESIELNGINIVAEKNSTVVNAQVSAYERGLDQVYRLIGNVISYG